MRCHRPKLLVAFNFQMTGFRTRATLGLERRQKKGLYRSHQGLPAPFGSLHVLAHDLDEALRLG